jgi:hypothetical protein
LGKPFSPIGASITGHVRPAKQVAQLRGKPRVSFLLAVDDIRHRGRAAAGVRLTGADLSAICRLDLYGAWRLLTVFEAPDRCILLLVAVEAPLSFRSAWRPLSSIRDHLRPIAGCGAGRALVAPEHHVVADGVGASADRL